ncbi:MAG TPA: lipopolysaccharide heptosyltransferase II [Elusimicrobia bacterium]|nr:lipopolysaccharide heptosyltransferase II [Elusimicrobiota bacterium]
MEIPTESPKILVIRMSSLGDIILTAPVLRNLKHRWPQSCINLLVKPQFAAAASHSAYLSEVVKFQGFFKTARALNSAGYDLIIDLHSTLRSRLLSALLKAPLKIRYRKDSLARKLFVNFRVPSPALEKHTLERYLEIFGRLGVPVNHTGPLPGDWNIYGKTAGRDKEAGKAAANSSSTFPALSPLPAVGTAPIKFCVFQSAFLGDCVLTLPLLKKLKEIKPDAYITVLTRPETAGLFSASGLCSEVITDNKKTTSSPAGEFFRLARELKKRKFDAAIIPHRSLRTALLAWAAGIPLRSGFFTSAGSFLFTHKSHFSWLMHDAERNLTLLSPLADGLPPAAPAMPAPPCLPAPEAGTLEKFAPGEKITIGINAGSAWFTKRWPKERWAALVRKLALKHGSRILLAGGPGEAAWNGEIARMAGEENCLNLTGKTGIGELMGLIAGLKLFITNDSGPMHIAAALGVPVAAVFGPTTRELGFFPCGERTEVIETPLKCRPCALHGSKKCPRGHFLCMRLITADRVFEAAERLYKA